MEKIPPEDDWRRYSPSIEKIRVVPIIKQRPCLHEGCSQCHGSGRKPNGEACFHMISCPCPKCSPGRM